MTSNFAVNVGVNQSIQKTYTIGGRNYVEVDSQSMPIEFVTLGGKIVNPITAGEKFYESDIVEFDPTTQEVKVLRTYEVAKAVTATDTEMLLVKVNNDKRKGRHVPVAGRIVMKEPAAITTTGTGVALGAVVEESYTANDVTMTVYKVSITANDFGTLAVGDLLVEADQTGSSAKMYVQNPNSNILTDIVFNYNSMSGTDTFSGSIVSYTPVLPRLYWANRTSPIPACILALNKSRFNGFFQLP